VSVALALRFHQQQKEEEEKKEIMFVFSKVLWVWTFFILF